MTTEKGKKRLKNIPILHDEVKQRHQIVVTPTAWENMKCEADLRGISISELIEEFGRRINSPTASSPLMTRS
jgi:deoxyhypusine synthase